MSAAGRQIRRFRLNRLEWMAEPMSEFVAWTREELNFRSEARYMEQLRSNARGNPAEYVPAVEWEFTSPRILVMEFLEGVTVLDYLRAVEKGDGGMLARLHEMGFEPNAFSRSLIDNFLGDAFCHGMFHADLHPANLMILPGNVVGYIDFGITGTLSPHTRRRLIALTLATTRGDLKEIEKTFFAVSAVGPRFDEAGFREGLKRLGESWYESRGGVQRLRKNFTLVMLDMLQLSRTADVWPERDVIRYIRSAIASDGLINRFAPGFDIGAYLEHVCRQFLDRQSWMTLLSRDHLLEWASANGRLVRDGLVRGASLLGRMADGAPPGQRGDSRAWARDEPRAGLRGVAALMICGGFLLVLSVLVSQAALLVSVALMGVLTMLWIVRGRQKAGA
jgi:predicted unusual protein kinase regulating ubiquinone biosynthesis (AarF/ABC1/UbiB family)